MQWCALGSMAENWKVFKEACNDFTTATQPTAKDDEIQAATLKTVMGKRVSANPFKLRKKPSKILEKLEEYFTPTRNVCTSNTYFTQHNNSLTKMWTYI